MAVVKAPALSLDASGNLGGISYSKWRGLHIARSPWSGTVPNTPAQQIIQGFMLTVSQAWGGTLTQEQRQSWEHAAALVRFPSRLGDQIKLSGYNYFVKLNMVRQVMGLSVLTLPVIDSKNPLAIQLVLASSILHGHIDISFLSSVPGETPVFVDADKYQIFKAGPYTSGGRHALSGEYRQLVIADPGGVFHDDDTIVDAYYWYKVRSLLNSGKAGNLHEVQVQSVQDPAIMVDMINWIIFNIGTVGPPVTNWPDQSGQANDYSATGAGIPTLTATGVDFDGTTDFMTNDNIFFTSAMWQRTQDFTVIMVITPRTITDLHTLIGLGQSVDSISTGYIRITNDIIIDFISKDRMGIVVRDSTFIQIDSWDSGNSVNVEIGITQVWTLVQTGNEIRIYKNDSGNVAVHTNIGSIDTGVLFNEETLIGARAWSVGERRFYDGEKQEELVWDRKLTETERKAVIADLMQQYKIT